MATPGQTAGQKQFSNVQRAAERTVTWLHEPGRSPWQLDPDGARPAPAPSWFFVVNHPRTGSSVLARLLNEHEEVYCGDEEQMLPVLSAVLSSKLLVAPSKRFCALRYEKKRPFTAGTLRALMEAWREEVSAKRWFGDKGELYYDSYGETCEETFPGCRFILAVRSPLDTLSSYIRQPWAAYLYKLYPDQLSFFQALRARSYYILERNRFWQERAYVVRFERMDSLESLEECLTGLFAHLGVAAGSFNWQAAWQQCNHLSAVGRWEGDELIQRYLTWIQHEDAFLAELLLQGSYALPSGVEMPVTKPPTPAHLRGGLPPSP